MQVLSSYLPLLYILLNLVVAIHCLVAPVEIRILGGQKCVLVPAKEEEAKHPTLVLIGGMAQTSKSWEHHLLNLSKNRNVLVYECLGQGQTDGKNLQDVSLPRQAEKLLEALDGMDNDDDSSFSSNRPVDLVGFSFGGRVAMATACLQPTRIRKMHLSGVASDRSDFGHLAIEAWKDSIRNDQSLRSFAWSALLATYSPKFLRSQPIERYLDHICQTNTPKGLLALLEQAEVSDREDPWHVVNMASVIGVVGKSASNIPGQLCVGEFDQMAPIEHAQDLCERLGWPEPSVIPNCGHAVGLEAGRAWRDDVLSFLND